MSEYINKYIATSIPVLPKEHRRQFTSYDDAFETGWNEALSCVNIVPSADVVEVVRCKDCKWWKAKPNEDEEDNESNGFATWYDGNKLCHICGNGNDFCSYGERKDNE